MRIIIAEDEQRARIGLKDLIETCGQDFQVIGTAGDGRKALELIRVMKPDVVFTDIRVPFISGMEMIQLCRKEEIYCEFVIVSAYAEFDYAKQAISLGVTEYLLKPVSYEDLQKTLEHLQWKLNGGNETRHTESLRSRYPDAHPVILKVLDYIEKHYMDKISQRELAESLGISPEYLSFLFKKEIGEKFAHFVQTYRIEVAKCLLKNGENQVEDIPYLVGFSDGKYFSKVFREITGESVNDFLEEDGS